MRNRIVILMTMCGFCIAAWAEPDAGVPVIRVRSEKMDRQELFTPENQKMLDQDRTKQDYSAQKGENFRKSCMMENAFHWVLQKTEKAFCETAVCEPDPKAVADWKTFTQTTPGMADLIQTATRGQKMSPEQSAALDALLGGPPSHWQANKALYGHYGGRVSHGNLGYYEPTEARLRLLQEMEKRGEVEFYDPQIRADVLERFNRSLGGAEEIDTSFQQREGMKDPWERSVWEAKQKVETKPGNK